MIRTTFKLFSGLMLGAAIGVSAYLYLSQPHEDGVAKTIKTLVDNAIAEGKNAADLRRQELEKELSSRPVPPTPPPF